MGQLGGVLLALALNAGFKGALGAVSVSGIDASRADFYAQHVAEAMTSAGVSVLTPKDMAALLGMERQKQLMGCSEGSSCQAEMAAALGADGVVLADVAKLEGGAYQVTMKVVWAHDGRTLASFTGRAVDEAGLVDLVGKGGQLLAADLTQGDWARLTTAPASHRIVPVSAVRVAAVAPLAVGVIGVGVSVLGFALAGSATSHLTHDTFSSLGDARAQASAGSTWQAVAFTMLAVGLVGFAAAAVMFFLGGP